MIRSLWIAKTGLDAQQTQMDVISNNLANSGTNGSEAASQRCGDTPLETDVAGHLYRLSTGRLAHGEYEFGREQKRGGGGL